MTPLSGIDSAFLYLEAPATPMHVASLHVEKSHLAKLRDARQPAAGPGPGRHVHCLA